MKFTTSRWKRKLYYRRSLGRHFLPSAVVELFSVIVELTDTLSQQIALLAWITPSKVKAHHKKMTDQLRAKRCRKKRVLEVHPLYQSNKKPQLEVICRQLRIPVTHSLPKFRLVKLITQKKKEQAPPDPKLIKYNGTLSSLPSSLPELTQLTVPKLRSILKHHQISHFGIKEQLAIRAHLLRHKTFSV